MSILSKYGEAKEIIKELVLNGFDIVSLDIHLEDFEDYYDEYIISINDDGIWCEKFLKEKGYLSEEAAITYISNECSSKVVPFVKSGVVYAYEIGEEEIEYQCKCGCSVDTSVNYSIDKDGETHGFTASKSDGNIYYSCTYYTDSSLNKNIIQDFLKEFWF